MANTLLPINPSFDRILTARDFAKSKGYNTTIAWYRAATQVGFDFPLPESLEPEGEPAVAFIDYGRWLAKCPACGGCEAADPKQPLFYCLGCGNYENEGKVRPVTFPADYAAIEKELLKRPVITKQGRNAYERASLAIPRVFVPGKGFLSRSWTPDQTLSDIKRENRDALQYIQSLR